MDIRPLPETLLQTIHQERSDGQPAGSTAWRQLEALAEQNTAWMASPAFCLRFSGEEARAILLYCIGLTDAQACLRALLAEAGAPAHFPQAARAFQEAARQLYKEHPGRSTAGG